MDGRKCGVLIVSGQVHGNLLQDKSGFFSLI
jgi:hypothetical protein